MPTRAKSQLLEVKPARSLDRRERHRATGASRLPSKRTLTSTLDVSPGNGATLSQPTLNARNREPA